MSQICFREVPLGRICRTDRQHRHNPSLLPPPHSHIPTYHLLTISFHTPSSHPHLPYSSPPHTLTPILPTSSHPLLPHSLPPHTPSSHTPYLLTPPPPILFTSSYPHLLPHHPLTHHSLPQLTDSSSSAPFLMLSQDPPIPYTLSSHVTSHTTPSHITPSHNSQIAPHQHPSLCCHRTLPPYLTPSPSMSPPPMSPPHTTLSHSTPSHNSQTAPHQHPVECRVCISCLLSCGPVLHQN